VLTHCGCSGVRGARGSSACGSCCLALLWGVFCWPLPTALEPHTRVALSHRQAHRFEPRCILRAVEDCPRHLVLGLNARDVNRPMSALGASKSAQWRDRNQFYSTLDLNPTGHMTGYSGHIPQHKYSQPGVRFAKATSGALPRSHSSLSVDLFRA
jgi:hypothetical protein